MLDLPDMSYMYTDPFFWVVFVGFVYFALYAWLAVGKEVTEETAGTKGTEARLRKKG